MNKLRKMNRRLSVRRQEKRRSYSGVKPVLERREFERRMQIDRRDVAFDSIFEDITGSAAAIFTRNNPN